MARRQRGELEEEDGGGRRSRWCSSRTRTRGSRQVCFSKRREGVFKKANELSVLCGAHVAVVFFSPVDYVMCIWKQAQDAFPFEIRTCFSTRSGEVAPHALAVSMAPSPPPPLLPHSPPLPAWAADNALFRRHRRLLPLLLPVASLRALLPVVSHCIVSGLGLNPFVASRLLLASSRLSLPFSFYYCPTFPPPPSRPSPSTLSSASRLPGSPSACSTKCATEAFHRIATLSRS
ncbi:hypothetical protein GUJ93_ZPchr0002g25169 [Zizania palustris]|uniref:MADS-box domain-containing protein n=1 Tax=Zizania palustris TaxID=103762 RepID=A0A8J5S5T0_ZIZPA|nr:hypothetical protein GUJ93_ZPchr0002g25169 [Zizania palustris]